VRLALYQPDIAGNVGAAIRLTSCLGIAIEIIGPCGFPLSDRSLRRAALDYGERAEIRLHDDWTGFRSGTSGRLLLLTAAGTQRHLDITYAATDIILLGRESAGAPPEVHAAADHRLRIPLAPGRRSLNMVTAAAIVLGEALRQTEGFAT
jgi:tRNA (cytidine/uridine-2'-O-)-methyltransferase